MTIAKTRGKLLQWSLVWPLSRTEKARQVAREIGQNGELKISGIEDWHIGYILLLVMPPQSKTGWYVKIRPVHWGTTESFRMFEFEQLRYIEFEYCHQGMTDRHPWDPSTYLRIKDAR